MRLLKTMLGGMYLFGVIACENTTKNNDSDPDTHTSAGESTDLEVMDSDIPSDEASDPENSTSGETTEPEDSNSDETTDPEIDTNVWIPDIESALAEMPEAEQQAYAALKNDYTTASKMTADTLAAASKVPFAPTINFDPLTAENLTLIQESSLAVSDDALTTLSQNGFVILQDAKAPTFFNAYEAIYKADLPVYISADSILDAVHRSYDFILATVERNVLVDDLQGLLTSMRDHLETLEAESVEAASLADLDLYLAVALSLLDGKTAAPVRGANADDIEQFTAYADVADGIAEKELFGVNRSFDFSQFIPRGHYDDYGLREYFKAMMWLGRIDFRLVETDENGNRNLNRQQVEMMLIIDDLMTDTDRVAWTRINDAIEAFVGKSDNMIIPEIVGLKSELGITTLSDLSKMDDEKIKSTILSNGFGTQQICSHLMVNGMESGTLPLNASFMLFGQRYVVDSHVFSNVVYDRVDKGAVYRMMPDPLDVAYAVFENDQAVSLLSEDLSTYDYASELYMSRKMVAAHSDDFWEENLYNLWLNAVRALTPKSDEVSNPESAGLSSVFATEQWGRRLLNTQLGSWAELRHDTLLYAKQSYTGMPSCEYPDAYVDPYPAFYDAIGLFAEKGLSIADIAKNGGAEWMASTIRTYFTELGAAADLLKEMATLQRNGEPFTEEQLAFVNDAVYVGSMDVECAFVDTPVGWYTRLFFDPENLSPFERDPVIADVHTQPADEGGNIVGRVLHVGIGEPRMMLLTVDTCTGPHAYVGPVFSYHEKITEDFERLSDSDWSSALETAAQPDVPWMSPLISK